MEDHKQNTEMASKKKSYVKILQSDYFSQKLIWN